MTATRWMPAQRLPCILAEPRGLTEAPGTGCSLPQREKQSVVPSGGEDTQTSHSAESAESIASAPPMPPEWLDSPEPCFVIGTSPLVAPSCWGRLERQRVA